MDAATLLIIASGATTILKSVIPEIEEHVKKGTITPDQQKEMLSGVDALRDPANYTGPEFKLSGR